MEQMGKSLVGSIKRISKLRQETKNKPEAKVVRVQRHEPPHVCQFKSKAQMDVWLFCMGKNITLNTWAEFHKKLNFKEPAMNIFEMPSSRQLQHDGDIPREYFKSVNSGVDFTKDKKGCRLCWGYGMAYIIRGPLLFNDIPGKLIATKCWCQR